MPLLKSNSVLLAIDETAFTDSNKFSFLDFVQSISFDINTNRVKAKHIGSSTAIVEQFTQPELQLNISFYQTKTLFNETLFGFNFSSEELDSEYVFKKILQNNFFNKNSFILFNDIQGNDLIYSSLNDKMSSASIGNLFLTNYSFSYRIKEIPVVNASFISDNLKINTLSSISKLKNWDDTEIELNNSMFENFKTAIPNAESLVYIMSALDYSSDFSGKSNSIGVNLNSLLDGVIQSIDVSFDLARNKFYFINGSNSVSSRKIISPINSTLKISGISSNLEIGNIKDFFNNNSKFYIRIDALDEMKEISTSFIYENLTIESFSYSININGFLEYSLDCSFQVTDTSGFKIIKLGKPLSYFQKIQSSELDDIKTSNGFFLYSKI